jgi:hypothetical protein
LAIAALAVSVLAQNTASRSIDDRESYRVYAALFPVLGQKVSTTSWNVIDRETDAQMSCEPTGKGLEQEWKSAMNAFRKANTTPRIIPDGRDLGIPYVTATPAELKPLMPSISETVRTFPLDTTLPPPLQREGQAPTAQVPTAPRQATFHEQYPGARGVITLSAVGFDYNRLRAVVFMSFYCGNLCAQSGLHFLQKVNGKWRPVTPDNVSVCFTMS